MSERRPSVVVVIAAVVAASSILAFVPGAAPVAGDGLQTTVEDRRYGEKATSAATPAPDQADHDSNGTGATPTPTPTATPIDGGELGRERGEDEELEAEPKRSFDSADSDVDIRFREPPPSVPLSGTFRPRSLYNESKPGVGYDAELQWRKAGPTGFGLYSTLGTADVGPNAEYDASTPIAPFENGGAVMARAGKHGGLWLKDTETGEWTNVGETLPAPFEIADAAIDPTDREHIFAAIPSNESSDRLLLYETTDGGDSWSEVSYFSESPNQLNDINNGLRHEPASVHIRVFDNGDVFLYNYNPGGDWGYHYDSTTDTWSSSILSAPSRGRPTTAWRSKNSIHFTDSGYGLLNPTGNLLYRTTDYGESWSRIDDLSNVNPKRISFASSENGRTIYVLYRQEFYLPSRFRQNLTGSDPQITPELIDAFADNHANLSGGEKVNNRSSNGNLEWKVFNGEDERWIVENESEGLRVHTCCLLNKSTDGGQSFETIGATDPFPARGPQGLTVDPDESSKLTAFSYMAGPHVSTDGGDSWTRINAAFDKEVYHGAFYETHVITDGGTRHEMAKPVDYRDVQVLDEYPDNPILVGSDQGLFVMSNYTDSTGTVRYLNIAPLKDHTVAYDIEVDDCGTIYQGLWHHSALIRESTASDSSWADDVYYIDAASPESVSMFVKDKSTCQRWASIEAHKNRQHDFRNYVSNRSGEWTEYDPQIGGDGEIAYVDQPAFFDGQWHYVNRSNWNLYATTLSSYPQKQRIDRNVRRPKKDRGADALWYTTEYGRASGEPENASGPNAQQIKRLDSQASSPTTSLDLTGSELTIDSSKSLYDVHDGRVIVVVQKAPDLVGPDFKEDILIYDDDERETVTAADVGPLENPFGDPDEANIKDVWVDPTDEDRYYARVIDRGDSNPQCPFRVMVTEDSGETWEQFSHDLRCANVFDMEFNERTETVYVSAQQRGIFRGNLGNLQDATDLSVAVTCAEEEIAETEAIDCSLDFAVDGPIKQEWKQVTDAVTIHVEFPFEEYRYELRMSPSYRQTLRDADCVTRTDTDENGVRRVKKLECTSALDNFPRSTGLPLELDFNRAYDNGTVSTAEISAGLSITNEQDLKYRNNNDTETFEVHNGTEYSRDRFDPHTVTTEDGPKVVHNDEVTTPAQLSWNHSRRDHHLACPDDPQYPGGEAIVGRLERDGRNCAGVLTDPSSEAPLSAEEVWTAEVSPLALPTAHDEDYYEVPLPQFDSPLMTQRLNSPECGRNTVTMDLQTGSGAQRTKTAGTTPSQQTASTYGRTKLFTLPASYEATFENAVPDGWYSRPLGNTNMNASLRQEFADNGVALSGRVLLRAPQGVTWGNASEWLVIEDGGDAYIVDPSGGDVTVYRRTKRTPTTTATPSGSQQVTKEVRTDGRLTVTVVPTANELAPTAVTPDHAELYGYRRPDPDSRIASATSTATSENVTLRIPCPRSDEGLSSLIASVGETDLTTGGYTLKLEYRINITRPRDIADRRARAALGAHRSEDSIENCLEHVADPPSWLEGSPSCEIADGADVGPGWALGNERINVRIEGEDGEPRVYNATVEGGEIVAIGAEKRQNPTMRVGMDEETFAEIRQSEDPRTAIRRKYDEGDIQVTGVGPINSAKIGAVKFAADIRDFATDVADVVDDLNPFGTTTPVPGQPG